MTEEQIERMAERRMDSLDHRLMSGAIGQAEYDELVRWLNADIEALYARKRWHADGIHWRV